MSDKDFDAFNQKLLGFMVELQSKGLKKESVDLRIALTELSHKFNAADYANKNLDKPSLHSPFAA